MTITMKKFKHRLFSVLIPCLVFLPVTLSLTAEISAAEESSFDAGAVEIAVIAGSTPAVLGMQDDNSSLGTGAEQGMDTDTEGSATMNDSMEESSEAMSFFDLLRQAGNIRYAIFAVFIIGLFLIILKVFDIFSDRRRSTGLISHSFRTMNLKEIVSTVSSESSHLMSNVSSTLLNVYQTSLNAENLQDEITTFSRIQQEKYNSFSKRVDFLSDTAGALGLLGTVWGMFMVFSSGSLEKDTILAGMGVALLTTLLGLIVSIILNFLSTLIQGYFAGYLESVVKKADELRFRLLEISQENGSIKGTS